MISWWWFWQILNEKKLNLATVVRFKVLKKGKSSEFKKRETEVEILVSGPTRVRVVCLEIDRNRFPQLVVQSTNYALVPPSSQWWASAFQAVHWGDPRYTHPPNIRPLPFMKWYCHLFLGERWTDLMLNLCRWQRGQRDSSTARTNSGEALKALKALRTNSGEALKALLSSRSLKNPSPLQLMQMAPPDLFCRQMIKYNTCVFEFPLAYVYCHIVWKNKLCQVGQMVPMKKKQKHCDTINYITIR